jgi:uncharacterized protein with HEPN domain
VTDERGQARLSLAVEHLQNAVEYARRGRGVFFDPENPDTVRLIEGELRKAYESLSRQGDSFFAANPRLDRDEIGRIRQALTHDYATLSAPELWQLATVSAPRLLRVLSHARRAGGSGSVPSK